MDFLVVAPYIDRVALHGIRPFRGGIGHDHALGDVPPGPLIGLEQTKKYVTITVEPNIANHIPGFLFSLHLEGNAVGVTAIELDIGVECIPGDRKSTRLNSS